LTYSDATGTVTDNAQCSEREPASTLHDFGDADWASNCALDEAA
jgi:hypothetical protein